MTCSPALLALLTCSALYLPAVAQNLSHEALEAAAASECGQRQWKKRGRAPAGFIKGVAASHARAVCEARDSTSIAAALAGTGFKARRDALAHYGVAGGAPSDRLRAIHALAIGEGMRESSGNTTEGPDASVAPSKQTADTAEAGLFQASYDSLRASPLLRRSWGRYVSNPGLCALPIFEEGIKKKDPPVIGGGAGAEFQRFTKTCPAFAVEYSAVMMRVNFNHFGPVKRKEAELAPACIEMLKEVENAASASCQ